MTLFQNKYRIASARLQNWDYANEELYFITICTKNREHYFGEIENGKMNYSNVGIIADLMWFEIIHHFNNIELGEFTIMPNHVHAILNLFQDKSYFIGDNKNDINGGNGGKANDIDDIDDAGDVGDVETRHALSLQPPHKQPQPPHKQPQPPHNQSQLLHKQPHPNPSTHRENLLDNNDFKIRAKIPFRPL